MILRKKNLLAFVGGIVAITLLFAVMTPAEAGGKRHGDTYITEVYEVTEVTEVYQTIENTNLSITNGISSDDLARGIATAMAAGGHQFDFSTSDWQGSIVGAWQLNGAEENNASFAVAKRFKEAFMPNTLFHVAYTPNGSDDWLMVGGTFRF